MRGSTVLGVPAMIMPVVDLLLERSSHRADWWRGPTANSTKPRRADGEK